jgi:hypothetical protein
VTDSRTVRLPVQVAESASAYPLPLTAEGVTAAWLSAGLRTRNPGVVVEPVQVIDGTATKVRPRLAYGPHTRRDGLPDHMCVKGGFVAYREYLGGMGLYSGARPAISASHRPIPSKASSRWRTSRRGVSCSRVRRGR